MRRVIALCGVALVVGCGGGSATKKKPDAGKDAPGTTDVGGSLDHVDDTPAAEVADDGGVVADAPPDQGPTTGDAAPETSAGDASDASEASDASDAGPPRMVTVVFTGEVVTVARAGGTGLPLGFDGTVRTEKVSGSFSYEPALIDLNTDPKRGRYEAENHASFTFTVKGKTVTGSIHVQLQVENDLPSDTFRYVDGTQGGGDPTIRIMKLDGVDAPKLKLWIAISDTSGAMLSSDRPPDPFPTIDIKKIPHTFSLDDEGGTLLMQLDTLVNKGSVAGDAGTDVSTDVTTDATDAAVAGDAAVD